MAYGKIKADTIVYDNSGTDTDVTVVSLTTKASLPASAGTVGASEVVQVDANKDITGFRNVTLSGNLTVNGTTTTINSTTLAVDDKNIELGTVDTPSDATANGGGITLKGAADIEWKWVSSTGAWTSTEGVHLPDGEIIRLGTDSDLKLYHNGTTGIIDNTTGDIHLKTTGSGDDILLDSIDDIYLRVDGTESGIEVIGGGAVNIYHHNVKKFETTANGVTVSGSVTDDKGNLRSIPKVVKS